MPAPIRPSMPGSGTAVPPVDDEVVEPPEVVEDVVLPPEVVVEPPEVVDEVVLPPEVEEVDVEVDDVLPHIEAPAEWPQSQ